MRADNSTLLHEAARLLQQRLDAVVTVAGVCDNDARMDITWEGRVHEFLVEAKQHVRNQDLNSILQYFRGQESERILIARSLSDLVRRNLREAQINHIDLAGNVFIRARNLYVWLNSDRKPVRLPGLQTDRSLNPFSKRASLTLRALFEHPAKLWGVRELSAETGLSLGHASDIITVLIQQGYVAQSEDRFVLADPVKSLLAWSGVYDWTKNPRQSFVVAYEPAELVLRLQSEVGQHGNIWALTLLAGAGMLVPHVRHEQMHVYVAEAEFERVTELVRTKLHAEPVPEGGNLHLMSPYYREATFYGRQLVNGIPIVSNIQLFLDLVRYPLRGAEAARMLVKGPLARSLDLDVRQVRALTGSLE